MLVIGLHLSHDLTRLRDRVAEIESHDTGLVADRGDAIGKVEEEPFRQDCLRSRAALISASYGSTGPKVSRQAEVLHEKPASDCSGRVRFDYVRLHENLVVMDKFRTPRAGSVAAAAPATAAAVRYGLLGLVSVAARG